MKRRSQFVIAVLALAPLLAVAQAPSRSARLPRRPASRTTVQQIEAMQPSLARHAAIIFFGRVTDVSRIVPESGAAESVAANHLRRRQRRPRCANGPANSTCSSGPGAGRPESVIASENDISCSCTLLTPLDSPVLWAALLAVFWSTAKEPSTSVPSHRQALKEIFRHQLPPPFQIPRSVPRNPGQPSPTQGPPYAHPQVRPE